MQFSLRDLKIIYDKVRFRKTTEELSMLVYIMMFTDLKVSDLLGWFNEDLGKRREYLKDLNILEDYESLRKLFTKKHQTYLIKWKRVVERWIGKKNATFEAFRLSCKNAKMKSHMLVDADRILFKSKYKM